jgi:hypothetical protein
LNVLGVRRLDHLQQQRASASAKVGYEAKRDVNSGENTAAFQRSCPSLCASGEVVGSRDAEEASAAAPPPLPAGSAPTRSKTGPRRSRGAGFVPPTPSSATRVRSAARARWLSPAARRDGLPCGLRRRRWSCGARHPCSRRSEPTARGGQREEGEGAVEVFPAAETRGRGRAAVWTPPRELRRPAEEKSSSAAEKRGTLPVEIHASRRWPDLMPEADRFDRRWPDLVPEASVAGGEGVRWRRNGGRRESKSRSAGRRRRPTGEDKSAGRTPSAARL